MNNLAAKTSNIEKSHDAQEELPRPASLLALEAELSPAQLEAVKRVAAFLANAALKIAREKGLFPE